MHICFYAVNSQKDIGCGQKHAASCGFLATAWLSCHITRLLNLLQALPVR